MNYTKVMEVLNNTGKQYNLSPRKDFWDSKAGSTYPVNRRESSDLSEEDWFKNEEFKYIETSDGKNTVPSLGAVQGNFS